MKRRSRKKPEADDSEDGWMNSQQACKYLSVSYNGLLDWMKFQGLKPAGRTPSGKYRFRRSDLDRYLALDRD